MTKKILVLVMVFTMILLTSCSGENQMDELKPYNNHIEQVIDFPEDGYIVHVKISEDEINNLTSGAYVKGPSYKLYFFGEFPDFNSMSKAVVSLFQDERLFTNLKKVKSAKSNFELSNSDYEVTNYVRYTFKKSEEANQENQPTYILVCATISNGDHSVFFMYDVHCDEEYRIINIINSIEIENI